MAEIEFRPNNRYHQETPLNSGGESKDEKKKEVLPVASGERTTKKDFKRKFSENLAAVERIDLKEQIVDDVIIPGFKGFLSGTITSVLGAMATVAEDCCDILIWGEKQGRHDRERRGSKRSYDKYYDNRRSDNERKRERTSLDYDDVEFSTRFEAREVLDKMKELLDEYDCVSVADYYRASRVDHNFTDEKFGWTNLSNASIASRKNGKYVILLPKARVLD